MCGAKNRVDEGSESKLRAVCGACGAELPRASYHWTHPSEPVAQSPRRRSSRGRWQLIALGLVLSFGAIFAYGMARRIFRPRQPVVDRSLRAAATRQDAPHASPSLTPSAASYEPGRAGSAVDGEEGLPVPAVAQSTRAIVRPANGFNIAPPQGPKGRRFFRIDNPYEVDMTVKLVESETQQVRRFFYVRAHSTVTVNNLAPAIYLLYLSTGRDLDQNTRLFTRDLSYSEIREPLDFRTRNRWVQLTESIGGTLHKSTIDERDFANR